MYAYDSYDRHDNYEEEFELVHKDVLYHRDAVMDLDFTQFELRSKKEGRSVISYYNIPASLDIETSSFRDRQGKPVVITYAIALNIDGYNFKMESWGQLQTSLEFISMAAGLHYSNKRLVIYIHNLEYEFQFMKHHFDFVKVFNNGGERKPLKALTANGIEFRCSRMLSGRSLDGVAKNLVHYKIKKLKGDLNHDIIHTPISELTAEEEAYILNDVVIIEYYIREAMKEAGGDITKIPLTKTGYVREYTRDRTIKGVSKAAKNYRKLMTELDLTPDEYVAARYAFSGGFTHAYIGSVKKTLTDVTARDLASSYPGVMLGFKYPMSKGELYEPRNKKDFAAQLKAYCCLFYVEFTGIVRTANEGYISASKAINSSKVVTNNGRVESAESFEMWMTDVDFECVMLSYEVDDFKIHTMYRYKPGYLPTPLVKVVIQLYKDKTRLKGVKGKETEYNRAKENLNSLFGMCVQDIVKDDFVWDDITKTTGKETPDTFEAVDKHNRSRRKFLSYLWGVWITAYGRYMTFPEVIRLGSDYVYTDTDSVYYTNDADNRHLFDEANERTEERLRLACAHHGIDYSALCPKDPKGIEHPIGMWELDGEYTRFKTLGAKRYIVEKTDKETGEKEINITVSGINKSVAVPYLLETYGTGGIFEAFDSDLVVPEGKCGKMTHTYVDDTREGVVIDYQGNVYEYSERSGVHLEHTSYSMSISDEYQEMIEFIQQQKPRS